MKYLTVLWATLILALACLPCMDGGEAFAQDNVTTVQADNMHRDGAQDEDLCTPLCDCHCCGGIKVALQAPLLSEPLNLPHKPYLGNYLEESAANLSFPFWHPPRA